MASNKKTTTKFFNKYIEATVFDKSDLNTKTVNMILII